MIYETKDIEEINKSISELERVVEMDNINDILKAVDKYRGGIVLFLADIDALLACKQKLTSKIQNMETSSHISVYDDDHDGDFVVDIESFQELDIFGIGWQASMNRIKQLIIDEMNIKISFIDQIIYDKLVEQEDLFTTIGIKLDIEKKFFSETSKRDLIIS